MIADCENNVVGGFTANKQFHKVLTFDRSEIDVVTEE